MEKFPQAHALLSGEVEVLSPMLTDRAHAELVHTADYLDAVSFDSQAGPPHGLTRDARARLGLPAHPLLLERSMCETAGTIGAAFAALEHGIAANLAGGTHHAFPDYGSGYCVLNDIAIAIACLRAADKNLHQILIVDTDAHQGNANHAWFADDHKVYTYSIHVGANYPARKAPGDCDVPLPRFVGGDEYFIALRNTLPDVFRKTEPDLVFWISGADNHEDDRFGQMRLTGEQMAERDRFVINLCHAYCAPTVVVYGGGYNRRPGMTAQLHAQTIRIAAGLEVNTKFVDH